VGDEDERTSTPLLPVDLDPVRALDHSHRRRFSHGRPL
jgi:hypothetical protein